MATLDLFEVPRMPEPLAGSMDYRAVVGALLSEMMRQSGKDRFDIASEVSRLSGKNVSEYMLDGYTAESRDAFNAPAWLIPAMEAACESHLYSNWLAQTRGGRLLIGRDALNAELGRLQRQRDEATDRMRQLKRLMGKKSLEN